MTRLRWPSALLLTAIGLYCSRGVLDVVSGSHGVVRAAMLPPWWELAAFAVVLGGAGFLAARRHTDPDCVLPLCALAVLAAPYLPWLPDRLPILRGLAGPGRNLFWLVVFWVVCSRVVEGVRWPLGERAAPLAIFLASALAYGAVAYRLTSTVQYPSGDEPHYLVITQSLLTDGDLKIENNHQRGDYHAYFTLPLKPDYLTRGRDGEIYSVHPVGVSVLAMPAFAIGGYRGVVVMLVAIAALAATLMWRWARDVSGSASAATFSWASVALTAPFLFNSFTVYPEIPGALALLTALAWRPNATSVGVQLVRGMCIGALPWLSTKYAVMAAAATAVLMLRARWNLRSLTALLAPIVILLAAWFAFFYWIWGTFSPSAPYGAGQTTSLSTLAHGGPGLFFDQEYGVVMYAPVLVLAFAGLVQMLRSGNSDARRALEVTIVLGALVAAVGAFHIWWGGSAAPGRPVASGILLLGIPIAFVVAHTSRAPGRAMCHLLLASSLALAFVLAVTQNGALLYNDRDGAATFIEWLSPTWPLTSVLPSFIAGSLAGASARTLAWIGLGALVAWATRRVTPGGVGAASLATLLLGAAGAVGLATASRPANASLAIDAQGRARLPLLDEFDARRRPTIVLYDPFRFASPADLMAQARLTARPGDRTERQPVDLVWNARFALPSGEYRLKMTRPDDSARDDASVGLQIGRVGPPLERWTINGPAWERTVTLPIDTALVGLRPLAPQGLGSGELQIDPLRVVSVSRRVARPPILSATRYGSLTTYFHDDTTAGEPTGYWTHGRGTTQVTDANPNRTATLRVEVRCGPIPNRVTLTTPGWSEQFVVEPGGSHQVSIPTQAQPDLDVRLAPLDITVRDGFVPADVDPASTDRRVLGCWIEMGQ